MGASGLFSRLLVAAAALGCVLTGGCIPGYVRVGLKTKRETNGGRPLYLLVRTVEVKQYAAEPYSAVASLLDAPDSSVMRTQLLYPGRSYHFYLKAPAKGALGLYFLFTTPGGTWNLLLRRPLPFQLKALLGRNDISEQSAR